VNNIDIHYQYADFSVHTPGYWKLSAHNDFDNGALVNVNGVPNREYHHKQILKFDFSKFGDAFTDSVRVTLTNLLNEAFVTLFAENQPFISAITPGCYDAPLTYSLTMEEGAANDKCIFIVEDSQLDIGLLIAVERNVNRIFQIISDYLVWNDEQIAESIRLQNTPVEEKVLEPVNVYEDTDPPKKKGFFAKIKGFFTRIKDWFKNLFKRKKGKTAEAPEGTAPAVQPADAPAVEAESQQAFQEPAAPVEAAEPVAVPEQTSGEAPVHEYGETVAPELTPKQQKKAAKAAAKAERKAAKEAEKLRKQQEKATKKAEKAAKKAQGNAVAEGEPAATAVFAPEGEAPAMVENPMEAQPVWEQNAQQSQPAQEQSEVEVSENE